MKERERSGGKEKSGERERSGGRKGICGRECSLRRVKEGKSCGAQSSTYSIHVPTVFKLPFF